MLLKSILAALSSTVFAAGSYAAPDSDIRMIAKEIQNSVGEVNLAIAERRPGFKNIEEICFRVGILYRIVSHDFDRAVLKIGSPREPRRELAQRLVLHGKSLAGFCGDLERVRREPGLKTIAKGDLPEVKLELLHIDRRAKEIESMF